MNALKALVVGSTRKDSPRMKTGTRRLSDPSFMMVSDDCATHRDANAWIKWNFHKEHEGHLIELQMLPDTRKDLLPVVKHLCRRGCLESEKRAYLWLTMLDIVPTSETYIVETKDYLNVCKSSWHKCPGCEAFHAEHLSTFGARFISRGGNLWKENVFDKHALSTKGEEVAKRILMALYEKWHMDYCPQLPDMVCVLLLFLGEIDTYICIHNLLERSRKNSRWNSSKSISYIPIGKADSLVFVRTFLDVVKERLPMVYRSLVEFARDIEEVEVLFLTWFERSFVNVLPLRYVIRIMDCYFVEGIKVYYRVALSLLKNFRTHILDACTSKKRGDISIADLMEECLEELGSVHESRMALSELPSVFRNLNIDTAFSSSEADLLFPSSPNNCNSDDDADSLASESNTTHYRRTKHSHSVPFEEGLNASSPHFIKNVDFSVVHELNHEHDSTQLSVKRRSVADGAQENFILVPNRFGSKTFYSESSLLKSSTAAGATMYDKVFGPGPSVTHLSEASSNFEFKLLLASAFGFRNFKSKPLQKSDQQYAKLVLRDPSVCEVSHFVPSHFSQSLVTDSCFLNAELATKLVSWLPTNMRRNARSMSLIYSTNTHGRSLSDLISACNLCSSTVAGSILLLESLTDDGTPGTVFGGYVPGTFVRSVGFSGDETCFLFRLSPVDQCARWKFRGSVKQLVGGGSVTPRLRLRSLSVSGSSMQSSFSSFSESKDGGEYLQEQMLHQLEQESRTKFYNCTSNNLTFGTTSVIYRSKTGAIIGPEDICHMSDSEVKDLTLTDEISGPGLFLDSDLVSGHTGFCNTYANSPLCLKTDSVVMKSNDLHMHFNIGNIEVWGVPFRNNGSSRSCIN